MQMSDCSPTCHENRAARRMARPSPARRLRGWFGRLWAPWQRRRSMGWLWHRPDDRLLRDIGLSRADLARLLERDDET